jgi:hypothetical protein
MVPERFDRNEELHSSVIELNLNRTCGPGVLEHCGVARLDRPHPLPRDGVNDVRSRSLDGQAARIDPEQQTLDGDELPVVSL